jgi:NAD(P)-dependent dehydrogenase (short-subunit alcohol dehydrogenase family)
MRERLVFKQKQWPIRRRPPTQRFGLSTALFAVSELGWQKRPSALAKKWLQPGAKMPALDHLGNHETLYSVGMDVTKDTQVKSGIRDGLSLFGTIDVLATVQDSGSSELSKKRPRWSRSRVSYQRFRTAECGSGRIARNAAAADRVYHKFLSLGGDRASAGWGVYCATTFAVEGITEALHEDLSPLGIHATVVEPGFSALSSWTAGRSARLSDRSLTMRTAFGRLARLRWSVISGSPAIRRSSPLWTRRCDCR